MKKQSEKFVRRIKRSCQRLTPLLENSAPGKRQNPGRGGIGGAGGGGGGGGATLAGGATGIS